MGIYDRDYYRDDSPRWGAALGHPGTVSVLAATVALFFVQAFSTRPPRPSALLDWAAFDGPKILGGEVWRLFTAGLVPAGNDLFGLIFSMILLFWAGKELERIYGTRPFVAFYLSAALTTSLAKLALLFAGVEAPPPSVGIGGAMFAVLVLFACLDPKRSILVFFVLPMPIALLVSILLGLAVLFALREGTQVHAVGYIAGAAFGFAFYKLAPAVLKWLRADRARPDARPAVRLHVNPAAEEEIDGSYSDSEESRPTPPPMPRAPRGMDEQLEAKLDQVLTKVAQSGRASLTAEEHEILQRASEIYKKKRS